MNNKPSSRASEAASKCKTKTDSVRPLQFFFISYIPIFDNPVDNKKQVDATVTVQLWRSKYQKATVNAYAAGSRNPHDKNNLNAGIGFTYKF